MSSTNHTFAICAYKESPFLEEAVRSVTEQTVKSKILIATSTPNDHIASIAEKYGVPVLENKSKDKGTIGGDWNFAFRSADTEYVTIVHHDDYYEPQYTEEILAKAEGRRPVIIFSEYFELRNGERVYDNRLLRVKRLMNTGFRMFPRSRFVKRRVLSFGDPICCPAVTFAKSRCGDFEFNTSYVNDIDWDAWIRLADVKGDFLCVHKPLMAHRIHEASATTGNISDGTRHNETLEIFERFWPKWFAKRITKIYELSDKSNALE